jgi:hypothetical protein
MDARRREELVSEYVERRELGEPLRPEEFVREHPEAGAELAAILRTLGDAEALLPRSPDLPARIGPYRIVGEIGCGGMGRVLEVVDERGDGAPLALKLLHLSLATEPRALERFRREGAALARLSHPGIVRVPATGLVDGRAYLAMEKVEGASLAEHLARARARREEPASAEHAPAGALELPGAGTPLERGVRLGARLARALAAAHAAGVLYRDLNPRNVLVRASGEPVVIDFGLTRGPGAPTLTGSGDLVGTPQYMAPEQARGEKVDERTDVFGLGAILLELLTLAPPRTAADTLALLRKAGREPLRVSRAAGVPRDLARVVRRATSFHPRWRYPTCAELADELERMLAGEAVHTRGPGLLQRATELVTVHRRATLAAALALTLALVLLVKLPERAEDRLRRAVEGTTAVVLPWLEGDLAGTERVLASWLAREPDAPFREFLHALAKDDLARESSDPATRALLAGERARRAGHPDEALAHFRTAWDLAPHSPLVVLLLGIAAFVAGELELARPALEASAGSFGRSRRLHATLAAVYTRLGLPADAERARNAVAARTAGP